MKRKRKLWEWGKTALILLLTCSACYLGLWSQFYYQVGARGRDLVPYLVSWLRPETDPGQTAAYTQAVQPVGMVISTAAGRYGAAYDTDTLTALFDATGSYLADALLTAQEPRPATVSQWKQALDGRGIAYLLSGDVPLDALSLWLSGAGGNSRLTQSAQMLVLSAGADGSASLWFWNNEDRQPYTAATSLSLSSPLEQLALAYPGNGTSYAWQLGEEYAALSPWHLVVPGQKRCTDYTAASPLTETVASAVAQAFGFNSHGLYSNGGGLVAKDDSDTLRIGEDGLVTYLSEGGSARLPVGAPRQTPTAADAIEAARALVTEAVGTFASDAGITLLSCQPGAENGSYTLRFGYLLGGVEVALAQGDAAVVTVSGGAITGCTLLLRAYSAQETDTALLPEIQAAAALAALGRQGSVLVPCYPDPGGSAALSATWTVG